MTDSGLRQPYWTPLRILDAIVTGVLCIGVVLLGIAAFLLSGLFVMATDGCVPADCNDTPVAIGWAVAWTGAALGAIGAMVGPVVSARRRTRWPLVAWPLVGLAVVALAFVVGGSIADAAGPV